MTDIITYLQAELKHYDSNYPWQIIVHEDIQSVFIKIYLPMVDSGYYELIFHLDGLVDQVVETPKKIILPLYNQADKAEKGYLEALLLGIRELSHRLSTQIQELEAGKRLSVDLTWPNKSLESIIATRKSLDRYDYDLLGLEG